MRKLLAAAGLLALAACGPSEPAEEAAAPAEPTQEEMGTDDPSVPFTPEPVAGPSTWQAMSRTAESFTGDIVITPLQRIGPNDTPSIRIAGANGLTYETNLIPGGAEQGSVDWARIFTPAPADLTQIEFHGVESEVVPQNLDNGGFCDQTFALAITPPMRQADGSEVLSIAAFSGDRWPPQGEPPLCGTFSYVRTP
jgi:hypothetical protein